MLDSWKRCFCQEGHRTFGQALGDLYEEVCAAACRVEHGKFQQALCGGLWVGSGEFAYALEMLLERRRHGLFDQVADERGGRVVHAASLSSAFVSLPQQRAGGHIGVIGIDDVAVLLRVIADRSGGDRELQAEERLVDVP